MPADLGSALPLKDQSQHQEDEGALIAQHKASATAHHNEPQEAVMAQFWDACLVPSPTAEQRRFFRHRALQFSATNAPCFATVDACVEHSTAAMAQPVLVACAAQMPLFGVHPSSLSTVHLNISMSINAMVPAADPQARALQTAQTLVAVVPGAGTAEGASPAPTLRDARFTYGLLGPVLGALESEPSPMAGIHAAMEQFKHSDNNGGNSDASAGSNLAAAADHATATFRVRVLLETDAPVWLSCTAVDTLRGDSPSGAKTGALLKTPPVLVKGRGHPHVFVVKGLKPLRRYLLRFDGLADASTRTAILHTPPAPTSQRTLQCITVSGHDALSHGEDPPASAPLRAGGETGGKAQGAVDGGGSSKGAIAWGIWGGLAERLAVPWHGVDLVMHLGGCVDTREALQEAVAWLMAADDSDDGTYNPADASSASSSADASTGGSGDGDLGGGSAAATATGSPSAAAAQRRRAAIDEAIAERFRDLLRKAWSSPSVRAVLSSCPQLMLPGTCDYGLEAASRLGLLAELLSLQGVVSNSTAEDNAGDDNSSRKSKDNSKEKGKGKSKEKNKATEADAAVDSTPPSTGSAAALQSAQSSAVVAAKALRAAHRCFASLRRVLHMYCRSLSPPASVAASTPREVPIALGASGDSASLGPLYGSPYVQLFLDGKLAVVALDLWGSNTGKPLDEITPDEESNLTSSDSGSHVTTESVEISSPSKAKKKALKKGKASTPALQRETGQKKEEPPQGASTEPRGLLGAAQWAGLLNLLAGRHPHQTSGAAGDSNNEDEEAQAAENGDDDDEDENIGGLNDDEDEDDEDEDGEAAGGVDDDDDDEDDEDDVANESSESTSASARFEPSLLVVAAELPFLWMGAPSSEKDRIPGVTGDASAADAQSGSLANANTKESPQSTPTATPGASAAAETGEGLNNAAPGPTNTTLAGRRVAPSVLARNWTHGNHFNELATLFEALLTWRNKEGREVLLLCGSGGGCEAGLESTLRVLPGQGPLGALAADKNQERTLGMLCSGPIGREAPKVMPQGFNLEGRAGGLPGRDAAYCLGYTHNKVVKDKNYAVVTLGVTPAAAATNSGGGGGAKKVSTAWVGWWSGEIVSGRDMDERHPLPHRVQADDDDGENGDEAQVAASLRVDMEALGAGRFALSQLRVPSWWDQKFIKRSDGEILLSFFVYKNLRTCVPFWFSIYVKLHFLPVL